MKSRVTALRVAFHWKLPYTASVQTSAANIRTDTYGVRWRGWILPRAAGASRCSLSANVRRGAFRKFADRNPTTESRAPAASNAAPDGPRKTRAAAAKGRSVAPGSASAAFTSSWMPVYSTARNRMAPPNANGASRRGSLASPIASIAPSYPPYAKPTSSRA